jgi:hypothetical protein
MRTSKILFLIVSLAFLKNLSAQPLQEMDSIMLKKFKIFGLHQMATSWSEDGKTTLKNIQIFDQKGQRIQFMQYDGFNWIIQKQAFDEKGRIRSLRCFDGDTSFLMRSKYLYTYLDFLNYKQEFFDNGIELSRITDYQTKKTKDAIWITETETDVWSRRVEKKLTRYTTKADSLTISEFVRFDENDKMRTIEVFYDLKKTNKDGNVIYTYGAYDVIVDLEYVSDSSLYIDAWEGSEKFIRNQLNGLYPCELGHSILTQTYNPKGELICRIDDSNKMNFYYNEKQQLIRMETFSKPRNKGEKEKKVSEQIFHYDKRDLPKKAVETNRKSGKKVIYTFEFK